MDKGERLGLPTSYSQMLFRIALGTSIVVFLLTLLVAYLDPGLRLKLSAGPVKIQIYSIEVPYLYILPAVISFVISRVVHLHDRISDLFGIRIRFDADKILMSMVVGLGIAATPDTRNLLVKNRRPLMNRCFYEFAGYNQPVIDRHLVQMALEAWTFYWVALESVVFGLVGALGLLVAGRVIPAVASLVYSAVAALILIPLKGDCAKRAQKEVDEILATSERREHVRKHLIAVLH